VDREQVADARPVEAGGAAMSRKVGDDRIGHDKPS
jgi:hypothetical protein